MRGVVISWNRGHFLQKTEFDPPPPPSTISKGRKFFWKQFFVYQWHQGHQCLTSRIKGDHTYRSGVKVSNCLFCTTEPDNKHSDSSIVVKSGNNDIVGHVPETLAKQLFNFMKSQQIATLDLPLKENGSLAVT